MAGRTAYPRRRKAGGRARGAHIAILVIEAAKYGFICAQLIACFIRARRACKLAAGANALVRIAAGWAALQAFSGDELVFNDTMKDWRTHNGMDLAGAAGDAVTAPTGAVVARAYEDPQWGGVVELNAGKLTVRVCGLADIAVKEGDTVAVGDALGTVGELPAESAMETHVHLEFLEDGAYVDPAEYFAPVE